MQKRRLAAGLLGILLGTLGIHNFYLGFTTRGVIQLLVSLIGACVFRVVWIFTVFQWQHTLFSLYVSYPISWALTLCAHLACYFAVRQRVFPRGTADAA